MLRRAVLGSAALMFADLGWTLGSSSAEPQWVDLLIAGTGAAGLSCALRAKELGIKSVLVVEKEPLVGGSSLCCGGHFSVADTDFQKSRGVFDKEAFFVEDLLAAGAGKNDPALVKAFVSSGRRQFEFLSDNGVRPLGLWASGGSSVPRGHIFDPRAVMSFLLQGSLGRGVRIRTLTSLKDVRREADGHLTAVLDSCGRLSFLRAKALVLATGGFANNRRMLSSYVPDIENIQIFSGNGNTGDGHRIGLSLGAELIDTEFIKPSYGFIKNAAGPGDFSMIFYSGAVILNQEGSRFVNEAGSYKDMGLAALSQTNGLSFIVADDAIRRRHLTERPTEESIWGEEALAQKRVISSSDLFTAAKRAGLNPVKTVQTIEEYNRLVDLKAELPFGRKTLSGGFGAPKKITEPPFFIMSASSGIMGTYCGLKVNARTQLIANGKEVILNVLAAGEIMGGVHGENFMAGCGFGKALAFGRTAAETAFSVVKTS